MWGHGISVITFVFSVLYLMSTQAGAAGITDAVWENVSSGVMDPDIKIIAADPSRPDTVYISSSSAVYKTIDGGKEWAEVLSFRGTDNNVHTIMMAGVDSMVVYAGTADGLYMSPDGGSTWKRIFKGVGDAENSVLSIAFHPHGQGVLYIGTTAGIFLTEDNGSRWKKARPLPSGAAVSSIAVEPVRPNVIYAATEREIYKSRNSGAGWKSVYASGRVNDENNDSPDDSEENGFYRDTKIRTVSISPHDHQTVYAGTSEGLLISENGGLTWNMANSLGLISRDMRHIAAVLSDPDGVYAATDRGVFRYSRGTGVWEELYQGLLSRDIRYVAAGAGDAPPVTLWAATRKGVFRTASPGKIVAAKYEGNEAEDVLAAFAHEPGIGEVLQAAIEYADVHPDKINKWKKAVLYRAWLPELDFDYGKGRDWESDRYYYSGEYVDDDITRGRDEGWSVSMSWELGKLIWSDDQTSEIDKRSEAMVELRDDILNEVTRLYFERRRLQAAMMVSPGAGIQEKINNELRLRELTAGIDALTGSFLSKRLAAGFKGHDIRSD